MAMGRLGKNHEDYATDLEKDYQVIVMGETGAGKSAFINQLLGITNMKVGTSLQGCTRDIQVAGTKLPSGRFIDVVDTPGFDDGDIANWPDSKVLTLIALWLAKIDKKKPIAAIVYIHEIRKPKLHARTWAIVKEICGEHAFGHLIIVTTKWDRNPDDRQAYENTESELKKEVFIPELPRWSEKTNLFRWSQPVPEGFQNSQSILSRIDTLSRTALDGVKIQYEIDAQKNPKVRRTSAGKRAGFHHSRWEEFLESLSRRFNLL